jgi:hypothetical protein
VYILIDLDSGRRGYACHRLEVHHLLHTQITLRQSQAGRGASCCLPFLPFFLSIACGSTLPRRLHQRRPEDPPRSWAHCRTCSACIWLDVARRYSSAARNYCGYQRVGIALQGRDIRSKHRSIHSREVAPRGTREPRCVHGTHEEDEGCRHVLWQRKPHMPRSSACYNSAVQDHCIRIRQIRGTSTKMQRSSSQLTHA